MSARVRAEAGLAIGYLMALPFVVIFAGILQVVALYWMSVPGVPSWLAMLGSGIVALLTGALAFMVLRLCLQAFASGVPVARWPLRLAPVVLSAAALTVVGLRETLESGTVEGLIVMPPLIIWGAAAGEWVVHRWLARGRDAARLFGRFFLFTCAGIAWLAVARSALNTPRAEQAARCEEAYADAGTPADRAAVDARPISPGSERTCADLRSVVNRR